MDRAKTAREEARRRLVIQTEATANLFNLRFLGVLCILAVATIGLTAFGVFRVEMRILLPSTLTAFVLFAIPIAVYLIHDVLQKKTPRIIESERFKHLVLIPTFFGIGLLSVSLSFHAVIFLTVPPLMTAQYRGSRRLSLTATVASLILVPVSVYGSFFFGTPDRNFIKGMMTIEEFAVFENRVKLATPKRLFELFTHYVVPRTLSVFAVGVLASGVNRRHRKMLDEQLKLSRQVQEEMERNYAVQSHVVEALATLIENRDAGTGEHVMRTKKYVAMIADRMRRDPCFCDRLTDEDVERIENAAPLHDVGKIAISDTILLKPGKLTPEEFSVMKTHSARGGEMIGALFTDLDDPLFLKTAEEIAVSHHERWDGKGYPDGKSGEDIPLSARIMAVADVFDALVSFRVYKPSISPELALDTMAEESGTHFDPEIMRIVEAMRGELIAASQAPVSPGAARQ